MPKAIKDIFIFIRINTRAKEEDNPFEIQRFEPNMAMKKEKSGGVKEESFMVKIMRNLILIQGIRAQIKIFASRRVILKRLWRKITAR